ncbi:MAG: hypothetical protein ABIL47_07420 [candidate division WOR-3 bacterium]
MIIPILKVGKWNDVDITQEILNEIVENYDENYLKAPVKIGHEQEEQLAYGYVKDVFLINDTLYAQIEPSLDLISYIKDNKLLSVSAELRNENGWYLVGIAFLGKDLPAVKGLPTFELSNKQVYITFSEMFKEQIKSFTTKKFINSLKVVDKEWDGDKAKKNIRDNFDWETLSKCVCYVITEDGELPENLQNYKYPFADVEDGEIVIVKKAVASIKAFLNGAMGNKPSDEEAKIIEKVLHWLEEKIQSEEEMSEMKKLREENEKLKKELLKKNLEIELSNLELSETDKKDYIEILMKLNEDDRKKLIEKIKLTHKSKVLLMKESYKRQEEDEIKKLWQEGIKKLKGGK